MVTFAVDQITHSLVVSFPIFVKDIEVDPLSIYEIETVHVPIKDLNKKAQSYSRVRLNKPYIAVGPNAYIQLRLTELSMCKKIQYIYYCEELFVLKHKSGQTCEAALFYDLGRKAVNTACQFEYFFNITVPPTVLDGGQQLLLANFEGPKQLDCLSSQGEVPRELPSYSYVVVDRSFLCDCNIHVADATLFRQLSSCPKNGTGSLEIKHQISLAFYEILNNYDSSLVRTVNPKARAKPQKFEVRLTHGPTSHLDDVSELHSILDKMKERDQ